MDTGHTGGKKGGAIRRLITILLLIPLALLCANGYITLYTEHKSAYAGKITLYAPQGWKDRDNKILGDSVDIMLSFNVKRIYNTEYYEGEITILDGKYNKAYQVREKRFYPNSLLGEIYDDFIHMGNIGYDYSFYSFDIPEIKGGQKAWVSYSPAMDSATLRIYFSNPDTFIDYSSQKP